MNTPIVTIEEYKPRFNKLLDVSTIISAILWILGFISMLPFVKFATHSVFNYDDYYSFISNKYDSVYTVKALHFTDIQMNWIFVLMFLAEAILIMFALIKFRKKDYKHILESKRVITLCLLIGAVIGLITYICSMFSIFDSAKELFGSRGSVDFKIGYWLFVGGTFGVGGFNLFVFLPALSVFKAAKSHEESQNSLKSTD